jgi:hypothetical protein
MIDVAMIRSRMVGANQYMNSEDARYLKVIVDPIRVCAH